MALRFEKRITAYHTPREYQTAWPDLHEILAYAPNDPGIANMVTNWALHLCFMLQGSDGLEALVPMLRPSRHYMSVTHHIRACMARLALLKRRYYSAYRHFTLAWKLFEATPNDFQARNICIWDAYFARRATAAVALGWLDKAEADIAASRAIAKEHPGHSPFPYYLALAEAALAHAHRRFDDARAALQRGEAQLANSPRPPVSEAEFRLMAARIARAEGNLPSFDHFCAEAATICREHDLPLTAALVQAVRNGAEY